MSDKWKLVLASSSPRRKELISHLGLPFTIQVKAVDESSQETNPAKFAQGIARKKAEATLPELNLSQALVVSADTIVVRDQTILGKPRDINEAREFLKSLSHRRHQVITAVCLCLIFDGKKHFHQFYESTEVGFDPLSDEIIETYLLTKDSLDKAGAYGIQGPSLTFINYIHGCYANVVGFPLTRFVKETQSLFDQTVKGKKLWLHYF